MPELVKVWTEYVALGVELTAAVIIALAALVGAGRALLAFVRPSRAPDAQNKSFQAARDALQDATEHSPIWIFIGQNSILRVSTPYIPYHTTFDASRLFVLRPADARIRAVQAENGLSRPKISSRTQQGK